MCVWEDGALPPGCTPGPASPPPPEAPGPPGGHSSPGSQLAPPSSWWGGDGGGDLAPESQPAEWGFSVVRKMFTREHHIAGAALVAQLVKNRPAVQETRVRSLGQEEPLEEDMAARSSTLPWRIPRTEAPGGLQPTGS